MPSGYVAVLENGKPQNPRSTYTWFKRFQERHGFRSCSVHDLRHTYAAMLSRLGVKIIDVSRRLGHSNTRITQKVYEYLFQSVDDRISDELDHYILEKIGSVGRLQVKKKPTTRSRWFSKGSLVR